MFLPVKKKCLPKTNYVDRENCMQLSRLKVGIGIWDPRKSTVIMNYYYFLNFAEKRIYDFTYVPTCTMNATPTLEKNTLHMPLLLYQHL